VKLLSPSKHNLSFDAFKYLSSSVISKGIGFLVIPIYTRLFGVEGYGEYSLYLVIYSFLSLLFEFGTIKSLLRAWYDYENEDQRLKLLWTIFKKQFIGTLILGTILISLSSFFSAFFKFQTLTFVFGVLAAVLQLPIRYALLYFQLSRKVSFHAMLSISNDGLIRLITVASLFLVSFSGIIIYNEAIVRLIFGTIIMGVLLKITPFNRFKQEIISVDFKQILRSSFFLMFHSISTLLLSLSDRLIINKFLSLENTATYSLIYDVALIQALILNSIGMSYIPILFNNLKNKNNEKVRLLYKKISVLIFSLSIIMVFFSKEVIWMLGGDFYLQQYQISFINILGVLSLTYYTLFANQLIFNKQNKTLALISFSCAVLNIVLNIIFIPQYGIVAASATTLFSYLLMLILTFVAAFRYDKALIKFITPFKSMGLIYLITITISGLMFYLSDNIMNWKEFFIKIILLFALAMLLHKQILKIINIKPSTIKV
jgi:O-antigen/teichoic acid export membrane protein